jgi:hypothetical protein
MNPRTKDGVEYKDGMTLYSECLGVVTERPTTGLVADCDHEYANGVGPRSEYIPSSYGRKHEAQRAAINHWLKELNQAREKLAVLNKEYLAEILAEAA